MSDFDIAGPDPRLTESLCAAARELGDQVRAVLLHSPRPVFLFYLAQTFEALESDRARGRRPVPATPAQQLCLQLMLTHAERRAPGRDLSLIRPQSLDRTGADIAADLRAIIGKSGDTCDFIALGDLLTAGGMAAFFAPFDSTDLVA
ncbi:hypothetical protein [Nocardia spumae]|uniref:hypothetical protein n=1 Tax=Nocardia spumae TaxID=2887190 RepID=UPI001D136D7E|nr:hypothetical protein [Nocardia spumae]